MCPREGSRLPKEINISEILNFTALPCLCKSKENIYKWNTSGTSAGLQKSTEQLQKCIVQRHGGQMKAAERDTIVTC